VPEGAFDVIHQPEVILSSEQIDPKIPAFYEKVFYTLQNIFHKSGNPLFPG
jgi:hypothetical protein